MSDEATSAPPTTWPVLADPQQLQHIIDIIAQEGSVDREKIRPDATLETAGLASMDVVMILMGVEEKLGVYIPMDADLASARNLSEFVAAIANSMQSSGQPVEVAKTN